jgi:(S)-ureidoglycine aminohydrolase
MPLDPKLANRLKSAGANPVSRCRCVNKPASYMLLPAANRVDSQLPYTSGIKAQVMASPALGAGFVEIELQLLPGGGTDGLIEDDLEQFFYVLEGNPRFTLRDGKLKKLTPGSFAWLPPEEHFGLLNPDAKPCRMIWLRRPYEAVPGINTPDAFIAHESDVPAIPTDTYMEQHLTPYENITFDMGINLQTFEPGVHFSDVEAHVMEHGLYMLAGSGLYWLNQDYLEVTAGDFIYMAPYCPQFYYALGSEKSAYLLYKNVNRDPGSLR